MMLRPSGLLVWLAVPPTAVGSAVSRSRSIQLRGQFAPRGAFCHDIFLACLAEVSAGRRSHATFRAEDFDLRRIKSRNYEDHLYPAARCRKTSIGVMVVSGAGILELVLRWCDQMWSNIPVVFAAVFEIKDVDPNDIVRDAVEFLLETRDAGGASAIVSISESGPGIPRDGLAKIFDLFFTTGQRGIALGLSNAHTIIQAYRRDSGGKPFREGSGLLFLHTIGGLLGGEVAGNCSYC